LNYAALTLPERDSQGILKPTAPEQIRRYGISISRANKEDGAFLRALISRELFALMRAVKVNKTFESEDDIYQCAEDIIDEFRSLNVEEVKHVFGQIRRGKIDLYGRLDTPTICAALREYDVNTACEFREKHYREAIESEALRTPLFEELIASLPEVKPTFAEILKRRSKLTPEQREEIRQRDKERCQQNGQH
jgi:hypothetical protein